MKDGAGTEPSPLRRYAPLLDIDGSGLDFGLSATELRSADRLARWLGVGRCFLKLETTHPTWTVKDRLTEVLYNYFQRHDIHTYSHASTGNTATSLVWGLDFVPALRLTLFVAATHARYHNFVRHPRLRTVLLEGADYERARAYNTWFAREHGHDLDELSLEVRKKASRLPYLEAFEQLGSRGEAPDYLIQTISSGMGMVGAAAAARAAVARGWLARSPRQCIAQPKAANPVVACMKTGRAEYDSSFTVVPGPSRAFAVLRGDASGCYGINRELVSRTGGFAEDATEEEIAEAKDAVARLADAGIGYTAATAVAALRTYARRQPGELSDARVLIMVTGADRPHTTVPKFDEVLPAEVWRRRIG
ncbi:pyridoxal-phosphate dependent enzyme [Nocardia xishanensis]